MGIVMTQIQLSEDARADIPSASDRKDKTAHVLPDIAYRHIPLGNVVFIGKPGAGHGGWVVVAAALPGSAGLIRSAAQTRFAGPGRPAAIVLTHGPLDHVGVVET